MPDRPRAPTPSKLHTLDPWPRGYDDSYDDSPSPSSAYVIDSPTKAFASTSSDGPHSHRHLSRPPSQEGPSFVSDAGQIHSPLSPKVPGFPDPSQFPDPYPARPPRWANGTSTPALSYADSSSASTRSSAYTNSARSGDFGHVHVATSHEDSDTSMGINSDDVALLMAQDAANTSSISQGKNSANASRWTEFLYRTSTRSRSSSSGHVRTDSVQDGDAPALRGTPSFDASWRAVDERDECGATSEEETDYDGLNNDEEDRDDDVLPTSALVVAEEGHGVIVKADNVPIDQIHVSPGTTHLLIGSSSTPNAVPGFLTNAIPHITTTLLALDISANFLGALPPALASCICLEELNIASNPLRALPLFLSNLTSLKVLIADSTGLITLPPQLSALEKLHTLSIRRNKMNSLPSWLCLLPSLETLLVDGNPFQGPWKALVEPLLAKGPMSPLYPPSTPMFPPPSAGIQSIQSTASDTDQEDSSDGSPAGGSENGPSVNIEEEDTITPARAPQLMRHATEPPPPPPPKDLRPSPSLSRTRTTPNRAYYERNRAAASKSVVESRSKEPGPSVPSSSKGGLGEREVRKMKSAGELRRNYASFAAGAQPEPPPSLSANHSPQRPGLSRYGTSASSSNLLSVASHPDESPVPKRFASLGASSALGSPGGNRPRPPVDQTMWDRSSTADVHREVSSPPLKSPSLSPAKSQEGRPVQQFVTRPVKDEKDKPGRWGFLKKMSMGKMRTDSPTPSRPGTAQGRPVPSHARPVLNKYPTSTSYMDHARPPSTTPQIDVRISTTGTLLNSPNLGMMDSLPPSLSKKPSMEMLKVIPPPTIQEVEVQPSIDEAKASAPSSNNLLVPTPTPRATKRRSFLPIDVSPIPIPAASAFVPNVTVANEPDDANETARAPSRLSIENLEQQQRREEERIREARTRALRSVMAYLRDMYDLGLSQSNTMSMYGGSLDPNGGLRSRRPTIVETGRIASDGSILSSGSSGSRPESSHLRTSEARYGLRSGSTTQTNSVATTDSTGSGSEERKFKDDKAKRARIIREIVETERTYVKGMQELVDIYIKPAAAPAGVTNKDTVVPAAERKIVFNGLEALFSFHKESFLPALERASLPVMRPAAELAAADEDGNLSLKVARDVAQTFVSHAAFMKMYSTYINNFDNSVQRLKAWVSDRPPTPGTSATPSSTAQMVGLSLTMSAVSAPGVMPDSGPVNGNLAPLSTSQKKRIKSYLKRCRMNPRHSQLNLEGYLLLPVQRIPRYRLLLEELLRSCPPLYEYMDDPLDRALAEISVLATNMNEGKRESESRRKLVMWQSRIRGKFPSPLVQPHRYVWTALFTLTYHSLRSLCRRLIMDGRLQLTRVVRKATVSFEVIDAQGDASTVQVECLSPELTPRALIGVLCNDLLVLCRDPSDGQDPNSQVDLWAVLRMQTLPQPASIVRSNTLRLVDNKAILYFDVPSTSEALTWFRGMFANSFRLLARLTEMYSYQFEHGPKSLIPLLLFIPCCRSSLLTSTDNSILRHTAPL
ncbi:hypothetical protein K474DRAFT_786929 [Panus rudis PR-1116 ss-1]|nr:hypothetical protein K474DRAFT_786929 [Panus rudis PR-1116 ss-1]